MLVCLLGFSVALTSEVTSRWCLLVAASGTMTKVLPHRNAMLQTQDMTSTLTLY